MSVVNRMLADLERRGAPMAGQAPGPGRDRPERRRRLRRLPARAVPAVLAVALVGVATALWRDRAPDVAALVAATPDTAVVAAPGGTGAAAAPAPAANEPPDPPAVAALQFSVADRRARLVVQLDGALREPPGFARDGDRVALRVPARAAGIALPALPSGQTVFRGLELDADDGGMPVLRLEVDPDARLDLGRGADRIVLTGRQPRLPRLAGRTTSDSDSGGGRRGSSPVEERAGAASAGGAPGPVAAADAAAPAAEARAAGGAGDDGDSGVPSAAASGEVHKSEPELSPAERARRLEEAARRLVGDGRAGAARERLRRALAADPARHSARDLLAALALRAGDRAMARDVLGEGVARAPTRPAYVKPYARLLVDDGRVERAAALLERAGPNARGDAGYRALMAAVAQRLGRHEQAIAEYTRALELDGGRGRWWLGLGVSLAGAGHPQEARAAFGEARASGDLSDRLDQWARSRIEALAGREE